MILRFTPVRREHHDTMWPSRRAARMLGRVSRRIRLLFTKRWHTVQGMISYEEVYEMGKGLTFELTNASRHVAILMDRKLIKCLFSNKYAFHAEELAVEFYRTHASNIKRPRIYVTRLTQGNKSSRPCQHCCKLLKRHPKIRVFFTDCRGEWQEELDFDARHISHRRQQLGYCR